jgi:hypothetical protein
MIGGAQLPSLGWCGWRRSVVLAVELGHLPDLFIKLTSASLTGGCNVHPQCMLHQGYVTSDLCELSLPSAMLKMNKPSRQSRSSLDRQRYGRDGEHPCSYHHARMAPDVPPHEQKPPEEGTMKEQDNGCVSWDWSARPREIPRGR